jgi:hypothetical protein
MAFKPEDADEGMLTYSLAEANTKRKGKDLTLSNSIIQTILNDN